MADRSAAAVFAELFEALASDEPIDRKALALSLWRKTADYDFDPYQMYCDEALKELGLARTIADPDEPGSVLIEYGPEGDRE